MEKSAEYIKRNYSPLTLAYLGDSFYETLAREYAAGEGNCLVAELNESVKRFVTAVSQSRIVSVLAPHLTEDESGFYKLGRNAHGSRRAKSAHTLEYRRATGLECMFGYLYLSRQFARARELFAIAAQDAAQEE